jgi:hypothetical protein
MTRAILIEWLGEYDVELHAAGIWRSQRGRLGSGFSRERKTDLNVKGQIDEASWFSACLRTRNRVRQW